MKHARPRLNRQEESSCPTEAPVTLAQAAKLLSEPWTQERLARWVRAGRLRSVVLDLPDFSIIKRKKGSIARIGIFLEDVRAAEAHALEVARKKMEDGIAALRGDFAAKVKQPTLDTTLDHAVTRKVKRLRAAAALKVKGGGDAAPR